MPGSCRGVHRSSCIPTIHCWIRTSISDQWLPIRKTDGVLTDQTTKEKGAEAQPWSLGSLFTAKNRNHQKAPIRWQKWGQPAQRLWRDTGLWKVGNLVTDKRGALPGHIRALAFAVALWSLLCSHALCRLCSVCVWMLCCASCVSVWHPRFGEEGEGC